MGLPEVIYTSDDTKYLHLPGLIMTENTTGTQRFLLSDNLGSVRQVVDGSGSVVATQTFDPYGNLFEESESRYGFIGEWQIFLKESIKNQLANLYLGNN